MFCRIAAAASRVATRRCFTAAAAAAVSGTATWQSARAEGTAIDGSPREYPWKYSVKGSDTATLRKVVKAGADINSYDKHGKSALHWAAERGDVEMLRALVNEMGFTPIDALTTVEGENAMHKAAGRNQVPAMWCLAKELRLPVKTLNGQDKNGQTALHKASRRGLVEATTALVKDLGFTNVDARDKNGETALHQVVQHQAKNHIGIMKILVHEAGCSVNQADNNGNTVLHKAAAKGAIKTMRALVLELGFIDVFAKNAEGQTALDVADGEFAQRVLKEELIPATTK